MDEALSLGRMRRALIMGVVMVGPFMALLESSIVNVALPSIMTSFGVNVNEVKWVSTAFFISTAVGMPLTGWLGRRIGLGRAYIAEMAVFVAGSALCAVSWSLDMLVFARVVQAIGAGSLMPTSMTIVTNIYPSSERGRAIGIWGIGFMVAPAIGPTVGGVITEWIEWRAIFGVNLPIGLLCMLLAGVVLDPGEENHALPFDWKGYLALGIFLVSGLLTLEQGHDLGWNAPPILFGAATACVALLVFLVLSADEAQPILPLRLFRHLDFSLASWLGMTRAVGLFGSLFLTPIFLQNVQGHDPIAAGLLMMPAPLCVALSMPFAGTLTDRFGPRWPTFCGALLVSYSMYLYSFLGPLSSNWHVIYPQFFRGVGMAFMNTPVNTAAMNAVGREDVGAASWVVTLTRMLTASATIALVGTLLPTLRGVEMDRLAAASALHGPPPARLVQEVLTLGYAPSESGSVAQKVLLQHVSHMANTLAFQRIHFGLGLATLTGVLPALLLSSRKRSAA
jgi:EmrB/QacA subfamily drug resistance transporter